jgi:hypothetical protein
MAHILRAKNVPSIYCSCLPLISAIKMESATHACEQNATLTAMQIMILEIIDIDLRQLHLK